MDGWFPTPEDKWPSNVSPVSISRQLQRGLFVPEGTAPVWRYPESRVTVLEMGGPPALCGRIQLLKWFREHCQQASEARGLDHWHRQHRGLEKTESSDAVSVVAVALYKTLNLYGLMWSFRDLERGWRGPLPNLWDVPRYSSALEKWPAIDERLRQLEIIGLMAKLLASYRAGDVLEDIAWQARPHPTSYTPRWTLEPGKPGLVTVVIRSRATEATLLRLMRRYASATYRTKARRQPIQAVHR